MITSLRRGLARLREILQSRGFRRLLGAQLLSQVSDGLYQIALASMLIFGFEPGQTPAQVTKVLAVTLLPFSLVGPFTGPFIDRFSRRSILAGSSVARSLLLLLLLPGLAWSEPAILAIGVAIMSINRFFHSTKNAVIPLVVPRSDYLEANAVASVAGMITALAGAVVGAPLAEAVSPRLPILIAAVCTAASAVIAATLDLPRGEKRGLAGIMSELRENLRDVRDGLRVLLDRPGAIYAVSATWAMRALHGFIILAALVVGRARFDIGPSGFAVVLGTVAVGGFVGSLLVPAVAGWVGRSGVGPVAFVAAGVATLAGTPLLTWGVILAVVGLGGAAMTATKVASDTIIMRQVADRFRGRAFAVYDIGYNGAFVVAALAATALRPIVSDLGIIITTGVLYLSAGGALALRRRRLPTDIEVRSYAGARGDETPRELVWDGVAVGVADVERSWREERGGRALQRFRLRLDNGRRVEVSLGEVWELDRELSPASSGA
ncbi:MAG TPA: MFS transporter [Actinomycetota bacterium]|nr:MFS transporter [Actinomycetota bacterium]